uniref:Uncharacterized protein n=1 Tax=Anguilla anguilla TaxID=7936 RepID=A0A0E9VXD9_ANGAN
MSRFTHSQ